LAHDDFKAARVDFDRVRGAAQASALEIAPAVRKRIEDAATQGSAAADLPRQRVAFGALSDGLIAWFHSAENPISDGLAIAHCPMAFDGKGAKWIQRGDQIANPYFGGAMLTCGSVDSPLDPGKKL
jgi:Cu(I)/Ag(I) efflux system membrane fusion protein